MRILIIMLAMVLWCGVILAEDVKIDDSEPIIFDSDGSLEWSNTIDSSEIIFIQDDFPKMVIEQDGQIFINDVKIEKMSDLEIRKAMREIADSMQEYSMVNLLSNQTDRLLLEIDRFILEIKQLHIALEKCEELKE